MHILSFFTIQRSSLRLLATYIVNNKSEFRRLLSTSQITMSKSIADINPGANVFKGIKDRFQGITITTSSETFDKDTFNKRLEESLRQWLEEKTRTIWFKIELKDAEIVPILAKNGFEFHHASAGFVMMYKWLSETEPCRIPPYAHTMVGCGAIVINSKDQILLVKERHFLIPKYKLPGGYVDRGENLIDAVKREVLEETNINTTYNSFVCFRHSHKSNFNSSDLYFIAHLSAVNNDIEIDNREIMDAKWFDFKEIMTSDYISNHNKIILEKFINCNKSGIKLDCQEHILELYNKPFLLYTMDRCINEAIMKSSI